jgi:hypothetical protein
MVSLIAPLGLGGRRFWLSTGFSGVRLCPSDHGDRCSRNHRSTRPIYDSPSQGSLRMMTRERRLDRHKNHQHSNKKQNRFGPFIVPLL